MLKAKVIVNPSLACSFRMILGCGQWTKLITHHDDIILQGKNLKPGEVVNVTQDYTVRQHAMEMDSFAQGLSTLFT